MCCMIGKAILRVCFNFCCMRLLSLWAALLCLQALTAAHAVARRHLKSYQTFQKHLLHLRESSMCF